MPETPTPTPLPLRLDERGTYFIGVDDGFAYTKIAVIFVPLLHPSIPRWVGAYSTPSRAATGGHLTTRIGGALNGSNTNNVSPEYIADGVEYTVLDTSSIESDSTQFEGYPFSGLNRVIVQHALRLGGLHLVDSRRIKIMSGLPLSRYYINGDRNVSVINQKVASLSKPVAAIDGTNTVRIGLNSSDNKVMPEGLGAWFDFALDTDGTYRKGFDVDETCVVVDIGGHTTDILTVLPNRVVSHKQTGSETVGVLDVLQELGNNIFAQFQIEEKNLTRLEKANQTGKYKISGVEHDVSALVERSKAAAADKIMRAINKFIGKGTEVDRILLVGGGANVYGAYICNKYPQAILLDNPEMANAKGFAKASLVAYLVENQG